jgi:putative phage-type endonuclease
MENLVQGTQQWIEWRKKGVGASEMAAILGLCPYSTKYQVWLEKTGRSTGFVGNYATQRGNELEARARARYELITMEDAPPALAVHPKYDICRVSLDGKSADNRLILEIKCLGKEYHSMAQSGIVPPHYVPQVQYQLAVTGADKCHFFSYGADETHALIEVLPDIEYQGMLIAHALEFWELVKSDTPPPLTERDIKVVENDPPLEMIALKIMAGKDSISKAEMDALKAEFIKLGSHPKVKCGLVQVSTVNRNGKFSYHKLTIQEPSVERKIG